MSFVYNARAYPCTHAYNTVQKLKDQNFIISLIKHIQKERERERTENFRYVYENNFVKTNVDIAAFYKK